MTSRFHFTPTSSGGDLALIERRLIGQRKVPFADWPTVGGTEHGSTIRFLRGLVERQVVQSDGILLSISTEQLLEFPAGIGSRIGLPNAAPLSLDVSLAGRVETPDGLIKMSWHDTSLRRVNPTRSGIIIRFGGSVGRLTGPIYRLVEAIEAYNRTVTQSVDMRMPAWLEVQRHLEPLAGTAVRTDRILQNFRIFQAGAFSLDVRQSVHGPQFDPVLMSAAMRASLEDDAPAAEGTSFDGHDTDLRDDSRDALLIPELHKRFTEAFSADRSTRPSYVLGRNTYLVVEPELRLALDVVKRMSRASDEERRAFVRNPRTYMAQEVPDASEEFGTIFVETRQYSERVVGLGLWEKPKLDWLQRKGNGWLPEGFVLVVGGRPLSLDENGVAELVQAHDVALEHGADNVSFRGNDLATPDVSAALAQLESEFDESHPRRDLLPDGDPREQDANVLLIKDNIDEPEFTSADHTRPLVVPKVFPLDLMRTTPKPHQTEGFGWLVDTWTAGLPGALLADDMGLGKTMQALAFLAWFRENRRALREERTYDGPQLVVAPTALLRTWQKEAATHLADGILGDCIEAFGPGLRTIKVHGSNSPENALDIDRLRDADWILTTYETLATYHRAFARIAYPIAIFDEMQKIKAPDTINTHAAKVMNVDFVLGMTGTPIENRIEDIWCIMDRVMPGRLGGLKEFSATYGSEQQEALQSLKQKLDQPQGTLPAPMLRRMKHDHLRGLPERTVKTYRDTMPAVQADAYSNVVGAAQGKRSKGDMLKTIHSLRGISLHPHGADGLDPYELESCARWIESSARVSQTLAILDGIRSADEKALVFIEDRAMQAAFAAVAAGRLEMSSEPEIINGQVAGDQRQQIVDRFQAAAPGFGLLLLSPKAAGIGLTITAANHVIHLSRWWNPAVEDQCNDRVYRIGQTRPVTVHIPMAVHPNFGEASFDLKLDALLERKRTLSRDMLVPPVSETDAEALFGDAVTDASERAG